MGYFDNCHPNQRFYSIWADYRRSGAAFLIWDWDQRRFITVDTPWSKQDEDLVTCLPQPSKAYNRYSSGFCPHRVIKGWRPIIIVVRP
jgi:hypothetical protein